MDQRRLYPIRERAQLLGGAVATGTAHDYDTIGRIDPAGDFEDIRCIRRKLRPGLPPPR